MANQSAAYEPSMEEILASIRQIISEDSEAASARDAGQAPAQPARSRGAEGRTFEAARRASGELGIFAEPRPVEQAPIAVAHAEPDAGHEMMDQESGGHPHQETSLISREADQQVSGAFSDLATLVFTQNARTLDDVVADLLRPMLKDWLDENLPPLVERLVREEIERVSRGRR
ncbi:hypothetical protein SAMN05216548_10878 [Faunimonas pinastri]|uniref:DUF2497 domain-containing protein n=1 Tax=Faunimonas pinastri TaxID=1855383 RepID=A0A1H9JD28_9HYPH|nr:DUF2497 domain-containing protein [Faunimonas pinastri]SEQ84667.1 hypothetical protein SAMN05216548_10878 [Faunimonas pinastri]